MESGRVADRWRAQRWDTLRLLSPNWQTRLPGYAYAGRDPAGSALHTEHLAARLARTAALAA